MMLLSRSISSIVRRRSSNRIVLRGLVQQPRVSHRFLSTGISDKKNRLITYLTDVEGDAAYLDRYVENSRVLEFSSAAAAAAASEDNNNNYHYPNKVIDFTNDTAILIYGGDIWDKGGSDLYVIRQLLSLKRRYPDRVYIVLGNRDINKMRIWQEALQQKHDGVWWRSDWKPDPNWSPAKRLQWILANTMGSPKAFEHRRNELMASESSTRSNPIITDDDVLQSYLDSCHAVHGEMGEYLAQGQLAVSLGQLLVIHGALPWMATNGDESSSSNYKLSMPWLSKEDQKDHNDITPLAWIDELNKFSASQLEHWRLQFDQPTDGVWATVGGFDYWPASSSSYAGLMQYGMGWLPSRERIPTIVYSSWIQNGMPRQFFPSDSENVKFGLSPTTVVQQDRTRQFMKDANVQVILSGHQPQGDLPTPIRLDDDTDDDDDPKLILACDTSYSGDVQWFYNKDSQPVIVGGRGPTAVCEVLLEQCIATGRIETVNHHGVLSSGQAFKSENLLDDTDVGRLLSTASPPDTKRPWWIKAQLTVDNDDKRLLMSTAEGFHVVNAMVPKY